MFPDQWLLSPFNPEDPFLPPPSPPSPPALSRIDDFYQAVENCARRLKVEMEQILTLTSDLIDGCFKINTLEF